MNTENKNIDDFNECVAFALSKLYESFPVPISMMSFNMQERDDPNRTLRVMEDVKSLDLHKDRTLNVYNWALRFLIHEGFVRDVKQEWLDKIQRYNGNAPIGSKNPAGYEELVLTAKGLSLLNAMPKSLDGAPRSFIENVKKVFREQSKEGIREVVTSIIAQSAGVSLG